jgi:hypothetical protein
LDWFQATSGPLAYWQRILLTLAPQLEANVVVKTGDKGTIVSVTYPKA